MSTPVDREIYSEPTPAASTSDVSLLSEQELARLDERFPRRHQDVLQNAEYVDVFEVTLTFNNKKCVRDQRLAPIRKNEFQCNPVSRHSRISDPTQRKELVDAILYSVGSWGNGNACFSPRHGIRAVYQGERIEMLICFECENFQGSPVREQTIAFDGNGIGPAERFAGGISPAAKPLFERILSKSAR